MKKILGNKRVIINGIVIFSLTMIFIFIWKGKVLANTTNLGVVLDQYHLRNNVIGTINNPYDYDYILVEKINETISSINMSDGLIYYNYIGGKYNIMSTQKGRSFMFNVTTGEITSQAEMTLSSDQINYTSGYSVSFYPEKVIYNNFNLEIRNQTTYSDIPANMLIDKDTRIPLAYLQLGLRFSNPYYIMIQKSQNLRYFVFSIDRFYINTDGKIHKSANGGFFSSYDDGLTWNSATYLSSNTMILGGITQSQILFTNHTLFRTDVPSSNLSHDLVIAKSSNDTVVDENPIPDLNDDVVIYQYEYKADLERLKNLSIKKKSMYQTDWGLVIGQSKTEYIVTWDKPESTGLKLEIAVQSKFNNQTRRITKQKYNKSWTDGASEILPEHETMNVNIQSLGTWLKNNLWNNVDTGSWISIPPTEMYYRYVSLNSDSKKAYYGAWTRLDFASGSQGIIETVKDVVVSEETINPETGEKEIIDIEVDGNVTEHINSGGQTVSDDESYTGAVDSIDNALSHSTDTIKSINGWLGQIPQLVGSLFVFIPGEVIAFIGLAFVLLMILKIAGR